MSNQFEIVAQGILFHRTGRGAYMPVITELSDGAFIACQHVGQQLGSADNYIEVLCTESLRKGDSATWELLASIGEAEEGWSYRGPDINGLPNGQLLMTASRFQAVDDELFNPDSEGLQRPELILLRSDDRGAT